MSAVLDIVVQKNTVYIHTDRCNMHMYQPHYLRIHGFSARIYMHVYMYSTTLIVLFEVANDCRQSSNLRLYLCLCVYLRVYVMHVYVVSRIKRSLEQRLTEATRF